MQLDEKRRHIEAEKRRNQEQLDEERRRLGQTAFWYVLGKERGKPGHKDQMKSPLPQEEQINTMKVRWMWLCSRGYSVGVL